MESKWTRVEAVSRQFRDIPEISLGKLAFLIIGEGSLQIAKLKKGNYYSPNLVIQMYDKGTMDWVVANFGGKLNKASIKAKPLSWRWQITGKDRIGYLLETLMSHLEVSTEKYPQAQLLYEFCWLPDKWHAGVVEQQEKMYQELKTLKPRNRFKTTQI